MINHNEAENEAAHLTKVLNREVEVKHVQCCGERRCGKCFGEDGYFINVFVSCGHEVDEAEYACVEDFCGEREQAQRFPLEHPQIRSLSEVQSEREEMEFV